MKKIPVIIYFYRYFNYTNILFQRIIQIVRSMYDNAHLKVRITNSYSNPSNVWWVGVHQVSVLSPLLLIIVMKALSCEFRTGCWWELLYTSDLVVVVESLGELNLRLKNWKNRQQEKGLKISVGETKVLCFRHNVSKSKIASVKFPCGLCIKGIGANSILCVSYRN